MKNKGYTLIELLGVMIILALLLSLVIPSIINVIKSSTDKTDNVVNDLIINAAEMYVEDNDSEFNTNFQRTYCITIDELIDTNYLKESGIRSNDDKNKTVKITYDDKFNYEIVDKDGCIGPYANGEVVYFDVSEGKGCTEEDYDITNSNVGYNGFNNKTSESDTTLTNKLETQNSCLKFYAFNDGGENKVNLLLDHDTTVNVKWNSSDSTLSGPKEIITQLKTDTENWNGTITPKNYIVNQGENYSNYIIDYTEYTSRLITANEIAKITGNSKFDELTANYDDWYYFYDLSQVRSGKECSNNEGCIHGWLYDRTSIDCVTYGCLNNSNLETNGGYWTATSSRYGSDSVWFVGLGGYIDIKGLEYGNYFNENFGLRPVIEVLKSKL